jgi:hypothetical protein
MIEQRQIANMKHQGTARILLIDHNGDGTAFDTFAEADPAAAGEARVCEALQHR